MLSWTPIVVKTSEETTLFPVRTGRRKGAIADRIPEYSGASQEANRERERGRKENQEKMLKEYYCDRIKFKAKTQNPNSSSLGKDAFCTLPILAVQIYNMKLQCF